MRKKLAISILAVGVFCALTSALAQTIIYQEDWGTTNGGSSITGAYSVGGYNPFSAVGWSVIVPAAQTGSGPPYEGTYPAGNANDSTSGFSLPVNTVYYTGLTGQTVMFYTTAGAGNGGSGDTAFPAGGINPASYSGLDLNAEINAEGGTSATNYFAVQVGGNWYVSATPMAPSSPTYPQFANVCQPYTTTAGAWNNLTVSPPNTVTIGSPAGALSGNITGFGIVQTGNGGWNYNELAIATSCGGLGVGNPVSIATAPISQSTYAGGGATFVVAASGSSPITYVWKQNGVVLTDGGRISGSSTAAVTITNVNASDGSASYEVDLSNDNGKSTASATKFTLTVNPVPSDILYAETVPYIGPSGDLSTSTIGWVTASDGFGGIYDNGGGAGAVYAYEPSVETIIYYTTTLTDTNQSGLAFPSINPANYPYIALETSLDPNSVVTDVTAYFAVQMTSVSSTNWYVYGTPIDENLTTTGVFEDQQLQFTTQGSKWNNLTVTATNAVIGSAASGTLSGNITGAGLVFTFNGGGGDFNWNGFEITTNQVLAQPPVIGDNGVPWSQSVASGGGVMYEVATQSGTQPFTYSWTLNGTTLNDGPLADGAIVSGSKTPILTIAGATTAEVGGVNGGTADVVALVSNSQGTDNSDSYFGVGSTTLTVINPPIGLLYSESFPWLNPSTSAGSEPVSGVGWTEAFVNSPNSIYNNGGAGDGAVSVTNGTPITVAYYTDTALDTNQSGLRFPSIDLAGFPGSLTLSAGIGNLSANVTAYWAVEVAGSWYVSSSAIPVTGTSFTPPYTLNFSPAAANWNNLSITPSGAVIGTAAAKPLSGVMTGAGLIFAIVGSGGDFNFDNFQISGTGVGVIDYAESGNNVTLSWVGNPAVQLQSATTLANGGNWANVVPSTLGKYSATVPATGPQKFFRLVGQ